MMRKTLTLMLVLLAMACTAKRKEEAVVVAYVTSWSQVMPDPTVMTHINYAFGHVKKSFDGVRIDNEERLRSIVALKRQNPRLKVMLSVGGWGSGNFSEMAADEGLRLAFARDCKRVVKEFGLDGIDIDWEYPTQNSAKISCRPDDSEHFTLLMRDLRRVLGRKMLLTCASVGNAKYLDLEHSARYMDFVNIMAYDMANPPKHHAALFRSDIAGWCTSQEAVEAHVALGVGREKLVMGMPFYGRGENGSYFKTKDLKGGKYQERWDEKGQVPYLVDEAGKMVLGFDNPRSLAAKCQFILDQGLRGGMYWEYSDDDAQGREARTVYRSLIVEKRGVAVEE